MFKLDVLFPDGEWRAHSIRLTIPVLTWSFVLLEYPTKPPKCTSTLYAISFAEI